jgi:hypothetical protein
MLRLQYSTRVITNSIIRTSISLRSDKISRSIFLHSTPEAPKMRQQDSSPPSLSEAHHGPRTCTYHSTTSVATLFHR